MLCREFGFDTQSGSKKQFPAVLMYLPVAMKELEAEG
jgi:hypothetical protein